MWNWLSAEMEKITFSDVGSAASIISFVITLYLFYAVRKIKSFYVFKAMVPELTEELKEHASNLADLHRDFKESRDQVLLEIARTGVTLESLKKKVGRPTKKSINVVIKLIDDYSPHNQSPGYLWKIYVELQKVIQEIIYVQSDRAWENVNG
jgi:hypothetical protein